MTKEELEEIKKHVLHTGPTFNNNYYAPIGQKIDHVDTIHVRFDKDMNMQVDYAENITKAEEPQSAAELAQPAAPTLRERVDRVLPMIKSQRMWFCVAKGMMELGHVANGDFIGAIAIVRELYADDIPYAPNPYELSKLDIQSFHKRIENWDVSDAPVSGSKYRQYEDIARTFVGLPRKRESM